MKVCEWFEGKCDCCKAEDRLIKEVEDVISDKKGNLCKICCETLVENLFIVIKD